MSDSTFPKIVLDTIRNRRSIRSFTERELSPDDLQAILNAANQAPSAHNEQSWRFIVVRGEKKDGLSSLVNHRANDFPKASSALLRMAARSIRSAPVVVAVANTGELIDYGTQLFKIEKERALDFFRTMEIQSSAAAVQNMLLAATSLGLATVWLGILYLIKDEVLEFLGEPAGEFMAVIPVGYAAKDGTSPPKRPLEVMARELS